MSMRYDDISIPDLVARSVVPARDADGRRGIFGEHATDLSSRRLWPLAQVADAVRAFVAASAAVNEAEMFEQTPSGLAPTSPPGMLLDSALPSLGGPSARWWCRRQDGEPWGEYVERCAKTILAPVDAMRQEVMLGREGEYLVDFSFVTEDETMLFEFPGYIARRLAAELQSAEPSIPGIVQSGRGNDGTRVRIARVREGSYYGGPAKDVAAIPRDARIGRLHGSAKGLKQLSERDSLEYLDVWRPGSKILDAIGRLPRLRVLQLHEVNAPSLAPLAALQELQALTCSGRRILRDVTALSSLPRLRVLHVSLPGLDQLDQIGDLVQLRALGIGADNSSSIASLAPLARLRELRHFSMGGLGVVDGSLRPLAELSKLRTLRLQTSRFTIEEFAELAAGIPEAEGPHRSPWTHSALKAQLIQCRKCKASSGYSTLGKPSRSFCFKCDASKIEKHVARWEILVSAARARRG